MKCTLLTSKLACKPDYTLGDAKVKQATPIQRRLSAA